MQPLKLIIPGKYWDTQIYSGKLYLFGISGQLVTIDWERLISSWNISNNLKLALICAFLRSDYLYGEDLNFLFKDDEIKNVVEKKFKSLSDMDLQLSNKILKSLILGKFSSSLIPVVLSVSNSFINK